MIATGLLTRTFYGLLRVDPRFRPAHAFVFQLTLPGPKYSDQAHIVPVYQEVLRHLQTLPGVTSAGLTEIVPLDGATESTAIRFSDRPLSTGVGIPMANYTMVSPGYFSAVGTSILHGRAFLESETAGSMPVAIISSAMAKKFWSGQDPSERKLLPQALNTRLQPLLASLPT